MCINPCCSPALYQLTTHKSQPRALVITALKAQINVPTVVELKGLNVTTLAINDRPDVKSLRSVSGQKNEACARMTNKRCRFESLCARPMCHSTVCNSSVFIISDTQYNTCSFDPLGPNALSLCACVSISVSISVCDNVWLYFIFAFSLEHEYIYGALSVSRAETTIISQHSAQYTHTGTMFTSFKKEGPTKNNHANSSVSHSHITTHSSRWLNTIIRQMEGLVWTGRQRAKNMKMPIRNNECLSWHWPQAATWAVFT